MVFSPLQGCPERCCFPPPGQQIYADFFLQIERKDLRWTGNHSKTLNPYAPWCWNIYQHLDTLDVIFWMCCGSLRRWNFFHILASIAMISHEVWICTWQASSGPSKKDVGPHHWGLEVLSGSGARLGFGRGSRGFSVLVPWLGWKRADMVMGRRGWKCSMGATRPAIGCGRGERSSCWQACQAP